MSDAIYLAYHKEAARIEGDALTPIQVGRALFPALDGMIGDETGENLSQRNAAYCEMTALFWAWKHSDADRIGLMHYRRLFDLGGRHRSVAAEVHPETLRIAEYAAETQAWLDANPDVDLVLPPDHKMPISVRENYCEQHDPRDLAFVEAHIATHCPEWSADFERVLDGNALLLGNMMLARRELLDRYCDWAFPILDALYAADIPRRYQSRYNARFVGFMAERLFTTFVARHLRDHPETRVHRANIMNLGRTLVLPHATGARFNGAQEVNLAVTSDRAYLPQTAALLRSIADHASPERQYNLFYLHENIGVRDLDLLRSILVDAPQVTLHPINVGQSSARFYRARHHAPSNATYNRFLLFELLPDIRRLLYLDADMVALGDVAEIYDADLGGRPVGAVCDALMTRVLTTRVATKDRDVPDLYAYLAHDLGLDDDAIASYVNAGVLVLDFTAMDIPKVSRELTELAETTRYFFRDQDILNRYFHGRIEPLPARFNVHNSDLAAYEDVPARIRQSALAAKADPLIVHFAASHHKPWLTPDVEFADLFWETLRRTPFWFETLEATRRHRSLWGRLSQRDSWTHGVVRLGSRLGQTFPILRPLLQRFYRWCLGRFRWWN